jgi:phospholipid/cholesterol/gamma-HCH transport system substrate-binding protein
MTQRISRFKLGLFFLIGAAIILGGLLWIGATHFFQASKTYVSFFSDSVEGLGAGASVSYLGVKVGRVSGISIAPDGKLIRVELHITPDFNTRGKAVELKMKGVMGGQYLAIDTAPPDLEEVTPKIPFPHKYPLIPSIPGQMSQIIHALEHIYHKINSMDLHGLVAAWKKTGQSANHLLSDKDIRRTIRNARKISADIENLTSILGKPGTPAKWKKAFGDLAKTAASAKKATEVLASQLEHIPPGAVGDVTRQVEFTLVQVNQVLSNLKGMVHELKEEPGKILVIPKSEEPFER